MNNPQTKRIGIIGLGWLGLPLAKQLSSKGWQVFGTTTQKEKIALLEGAELTPYLWKESDQLPEWMGSIQTLIINIPPTKTENYNQLVKTLCDSVTKDCHVVFISSTGIYTNQNGVTNEHSLLNLTSALHLAEEVVKNKLNFTVLRLAGLIGNERHPIHYLAGRTVNNGNWPVNLLTLTDAITAIEKVVSLPATNLAFNICNPVHPSKMEYYASIAEKLALPLPTFLTGESEGKSIDSSLFQNTFQFCYIASIYEV